MFCKISVYAIPPDFIEIIRYKVCCGKLQKYILEIELIIRIIIAIEV